MKMIDYDGEGTETLKRLCKRFGKKMMAGNILMVVSYDPKGDRIEVGQ